MEQGKIARPSGYDTADLVAEGQPQRVRRALGQLLRQPQNNLALFAGGRPVAPGGPAAAAHGGVPGSGGSQAAVGSREMGNGNRGSRSSSNTEAAAASQAIAGCTDSSNDLSWVAEAVAGLLAPLTASERPAALVRLLAAVLEREGILPRLLAAQRLCAYDVEGVYRLYCQTTGREP